MADSGPEPATSVPVVVPAPTRNPLRRLYHWILSWANHPMGTVALAVFSFLDSFIFPIPPLFLQVALSLEKPKRSYWYACVDTAASVVGSIVGFYVGYALYDSVGKWVVETWHMEASFARAGDEFGKNAFAFILFYSFLPFPYKVITIGSGFFHDKVSLFTLLAASTVGRGFRFNALATLCFFMGPRVKTFIEKYFNLVCVGVGLLVIGVLVVMKLYSK